jgi:hypothetical protein
MYKVIFNNKIIDVVCSPCFVRFTPSGHIAGTDSSSAQGVVCSDMRTVYSFEPVEHARVKGVASVEKITLEEFNRLRDLLNSEQELELDETALIKAKREAISRLSNFCKNTITAGFTIMLSDDKEYNFKLTVEDQLNLMLIENQLLAGAETFIYHATDEPCKFFNLTDMTKILDTFKQFIRYHTTYFNAAKQYINSLRSIEKINQFTYGTDVSDILSDPVLKRLLKNGGSIE